MFSLSHGRKFVQYVLPAVIRPLRVLWNQIIGFIFLVLTVWATPRTIRSVREFNGNPESLVHLLLSTVFVGLMGGFSIYSFWRAHKVPKSH
jgi:EamA domain-containing membrane protein RarD